VWRKTCTGGNELLYMEKILELKNLKTYFATDGGIARAVDGVSFSLARNRTLGVVGDRGAVNR